MRAKSNNLSSLTKKRNTEGSSMMPILENLQDNSNSGKSKSRRSNHEASQGILYPKH